MMGEWESVLLASSSSATSIDLPNNNDNFLGFRDTTPDYLSSLPPYTKAVMQDDDGGTYFTCLDQLEFPTGYLEDALLELCHPAAAAKRRRYYDLQENYSAQNFHAIATASAAAASSAGSSGGGGQLLCVDEGQRWDMMSSYSSSPSSSNFYNGSVSPVSQCTDPVSVDKVKDHHSNSNSTRTSGGGGDQVMHRPSSWLKREANVKEEEADNEDEEQRKHTSATKKTDTRREKKRKRVAYPFALVKPGGGEGEVTIEEINSRILTAPSRPVRHPVGEYACRPCVSSGRVGGTSTGLSGKAVVALTRIYTQGGKGTVTIIRTKG
ncbi:Protein XRI1 [Linum perenne]